MFLKILKSKYLYDHLMSKPKNIKFRMRLTLSECDVGMRRLFLELQQIEASATDESEVNKRKKIHLLHILHAYCQNKNLGEAAPPFQFEISQKPNELIVDSKAKQNEDIADGASSDSLGIDALQARFKPTIG